MVELSDDELGVIFRSISHPTDRSSLSLVCKQWLRVEGLTRTSLRTLAPDRLPNLLPRFPNLTAFESPAPIDDAKVLFLASHCPKIETLYLDFDGGGCVLDEDLASEDVSDVGLYAIAKWCKNLSSLSVRSRKRIGDVGIFSLVRFSCNVSCLDLSFCTALTDQALLAVGLMRSIRSLSLQGCYLITDKGIAMLSFEPLLQNLRKLVLCGCNRITDLGVVSLSKMVSLEELNLAGCGPEITELGGLAISRIQSLKTLNLSGLNVADLTLILVAEGCRNLVALMISGCRNIKGHGLVAFAEHKSLQVFLMGSCDWVPVECIKQLVCGCLSLRNIYLDSEMMSLIPLQDLSNLYWLDWIWM